MLSETKSEFWYTGSSLRVSGCDCVTNFEPHASPEISNHKQRGKTRNLEPTTICDNLQKICDEVLSQSKIVLQFL